MTTKCTTGGGTASKRGKKAEAVIESAILSEGYTKLSDGLKHDLVDSRPSNIVEGYVAHFEEFGSRWFARHCKYFINVYGIPFYADFIVFDKGKLPIGFVIECKWQASKGSADDKYLANFLTLTKLPCPAAMILDGGLEGGSYRLAIPRYLESIATEKTRFFHGIGAFMKWSQEAL